MPAYYTNPNDFSNEVRRPSLGHRILAVLIIVVLVTQGIFFRSPEAFAATYVFTQSSWSGGADTANFPTHSANRTNWTKYYSKDSSVTASGNTMVLSQTAATATSTKYLFSDTAGGATSTLLYASARGTGSAIALCSYDHSGADWTPTNGDTWDLDSSASIGIAGVHCNIGTFTVPSGTIYVYAYDGTKYGSLTIMARSVTVTGTLSASEKGYLTDTGPGKGYNANTGCNGALGTGAGHGGVGGSVGSNYGGTVYDSTLAPYQMGSGGGSGGCPEGGKGGGVVRLFASGSIALNGSITANGAIGGSNNGAGGGGAGGSIYLDSGSVSGAGTLSATGGNGNNSDASGGGGGGIIAVHYDSSTWSGTASVTAGTGGSGAEDGSVALVDDDDSILTISAGPFRFTNANDSKYNFTTISITNSQTARVTPGEPITMTATTMTIGSGATLSANSAGYASTLGPSPGSNKADQGSAGGGGHYGAGGTANVSGGAASGDSASAPTQMGSGGGNANTNIKGGYGGGFIRAIISGTLTVSGTASANGGVGGWDGTSAGGGGAGGTIYLTAGTIAGAGTITATGGNGGNTTSGGGGGGGIVSLHYGTSYTFSGTITVTKGSGGTGAGDGASNNYNDLASTPSTFAIGGTRASGASNSGLLYVLYKKVLAYFAPRTAHAASGTGTFESATIDLNTTTATFNQLTVASTTPSGATIQVQVAGSSNGSTWSYVGPDGTSDTYFTKAVTALPSGLNGKRYIRYKITLTANETLLDVPIVDSVSFSYSTNDYPSEATFVSSPFNAEDSANILSSIAWTATTPSNTTVKFQIRTAPNSSGGPGTWTSYYGPDGTTSTYFTTAAGTDSMPSVFTNGASDQWFQYKAFMGSSDGASTPTLSAVTVTYVVNAAPDFNASYGTSGVTALQVATTTDSNWGKLEISYSVRDTDTTTGTANAGYVTPSFEYNLSDGNGWQSITSAYLSSGAVSNKAVDVSTYITYTAYWNAASQIANTATTTAQIRVTINDNEAANNTASASITGISIDTKAPTLSVARFNSALAQMTLMASDTVNYIQYELSNSSTVVPDGSNSISGIWQSVGAVSTSTTFSWIGSGSSASEPVYVVLRDVYNNAIATTTVRAPKVPSSIDIKDASNVTSGEYRILTSWPVYTNETGATFSGYEASRSTNGTDYSLLTTVADRTQNYYLDTGLATTSTYYYKVNVLDADGDRSRYTSAVSEVPNGVNSLANDTIAPTISAVSYGTPQSTYATITWTTDEASNSVVEYSTASANSYASVASSTSYVSSHSVTLSGLTSATAYVFRVKSTDLAGNVTTSTSGSYAFTTATAMTVSSVSAGTIGETSATITWTTNADSDSYVVYARSTSDLSAGTNATTTGSASLVGGAGPSYAHSVGLSSLLENSTYYYYVKSTDSAGNTITNNNGGSYYSFLTTYDTAVPVISNVAVALKTSDSAVVTWTTDEASDSQISWGTVSGTLGSASARNATLTLNHSATANNLSVSTKYYYQVNSADSHGNRATSTESDFTTTAGDQTITRIVSAGGGGVSSIIGVDQKEHDKVKAERDKLLGEKDAKPPVITSVSVTEIKPFSAVLNISANEPALPIIQFGASKDLLDKSVSAKEYGTTATVPLYGLRFGTDYHLNIVAVDKAGNLSLATTTTFKTLYAAEALPDITKIENAENFQDQLESVIDSVMPSLNPPYVGELSLEDVTDTTATLLWSTNTKTYGSLFYAEESELKAGSSTDAYPHSVSDTGEKSTGHKVTLTGLAPLAKYRARATSFAIFGVNGQSKEITFTTKASKIKPEVLSVGNTSFTVFWKTNDPTTSVLSYTNLKTGQIGTVALSDYTLNHTVMAENLESNAVYEVRVSGVARNGASASAQQTLTVRTKLDTHPPKISGVTISNAFIPSRQDRLQTVLTWKTDEPANSMIRYEEGVGVDFIKPTEVADTAFGENHALVISQLKPGRIYRIQLLSSDGSGNTASSSIKTLATPRADESVLSVIVKNFQDTFGYLK